MTWWAMLVVWPLGYLVGRSADDHNVWLLLGVSFAVGLATSVVDRWSV